MLSMQHVKREKKKKKKKSAVKTCRSLTHAYLKRESFFFFGIIYSPPSEEYDVNVGSELPDIFLYSVG